MRHTPGRFAALLLLSALFLAVSRVSAATPPVREAGLDPALVEARAERLLARADLADYRGWLKYLLFLSSEKAPRRPADAEDPIARLAEWTDRIEADPQVLSRLRGVQEWAYESSADESGQPFRIAFPSDYDPAKPAALIVYMHGYSGNHLEHSTGLASQPGTFQVAVLGRARGGWYRGLSEDDVLRVVDYLQAHWNIDPDRVRLAGGSMGGGATFRLGSRYPHRWASGKITCGYGTHIPVNNLLTLPLYATHSRDDFTVPVALMRSAFARLRGRGGHAIADETDGLGHAAWDYAEGNRRGSLWELEQRRPASRTVRLVDYTATDGGAVRGWWGIVSEWGEKPQPARMVLSADAHNGLFAELFNIRRLTLLLDEAPVDRSRDLAVSANGGLPLSWPAPLPSSLDLVFQDGSWRLRAAVSERPEHPLHTPGGALLLYRGEPLLIVYGTQGNAKENASMKTAAEAASASPNPSWAAEKGEAAPDGVPHHRLLYGNLQIRADRDLSDEDLATKHLVLIGTAAQNSVVARLAEKLPVKFESGDFVCSDGQRFPAAKAQLSFVHYNPLAPQRLIHWVAAPDASSYRPDAVAPRFADLVGLGADLIVADTEKKCLVAARSLDTDWRWNDGRAESPLLPAGGSNRDLASLLAEALLRSTGAEYALGGFSNAPTAAAWLPGQTRLSDLLIAAYFAPVVVFEQETGDFARAAKKLSENPDSAPSTTGKRTCLLVPAPAGVPESKSKTVRLVADAESFWTYCVATHSAPERCIVSEFTLQEALDNNALRR